MASQTRIAELANIISINTTKINDYLQSNNLPQPSFDVNGPVQPIPSGLPELEDARLRAVEASIELQQLLQGADKLLLPEVNMTSLHAIYRFNLPSLFPIDEEITFSSLAEKADLAENDLSRIVRHVIAHHRVFCEPRKGVLAHSTASRRMAESALVRAIMWLTFEEVWPACAKTVDAMEKFRKSQEPNASGFALANNTTLPFYEYLSNYPERAQKFSQAMSGAPTAGLQTLATNFPWSSLQPNSLVLDLGGSQGHVSSFLAAQFPHLRFVVQDLPAVMANLTFQIPEDLKERVELMAYDFFEMQDETKINDVEVVLLRYIFHNWSDEYCVRILRNLRGVLRKGARVVVQDHLLPEPGTLGLLKENGIRSMDMIMLSLFNSRERDEEDWRKLFCLADPRFVFESAKRAKVGEVSAVVVASWDV